MKHEHKKKAFKLSENIMEPESCASDEIYALQSLLARYGYLSGAYHPGCYDETTRNAMAQFQSYYRIYPEKDGCCDKETIGLINQPRCGMADPPPSHRDPTGRLAPYVTVKATGDNPSIT